MKVRVAESITVEMPPLTLVVHVEDASKGDVISGRVEKISEESQTYKVGGVYEFPRENIQTKW